MAKNQVVKVGTKITHTLFGGGRYDAIVERIEKCPNGSKYGKVVSSMKMENRSRNYVLELNNGHWCYGDQVLAILDK